MRISERFKKVYTTITNSISFYPTVIAFFYAVLAFIILSSPMSRLAEWMVAELPFITFADLSTTRAILTTLIGSIISLMVLSFTMIMVVLGQAINNYSPKILLELTGERFHQLVLGNYLGTIVFSLIMLLSFKSKDDYSVATVGVFIAIIMALWCLLLFVYFIHYTSQSLQSNVITQGIYLSAKKRLEKHNKRIADYPEVDVELPSEKPTYVTAWQSGYLQSWEEGALLSLAEKKEWIIYIHATRGDFIVEGVPFVQIWGVSKDEKEKLKGELDSYFIFADGENIDFSYHYGMTQLMEIAIKALSPSLNDPGTARLCIHYLTDLFKIHMQEKDCGRLDNEEGQLRLAWDVHDFKSLFNKCFMPIMHYGETDISIQLGLIKGIESLSLFDQYEEHYDLYKPYLETAKSNVQKIIRNDAQNEFASKRLPRDLSFVDNTDESSEG